MSRHARWSRVSIVAMLLAFVPPIVTRATAADSPDSKATHQQDEAAQVAAGEESAEAEADVTFVTFAGLSVGVDPATGALRPLTPAEASQLAAAMRRLFQNKGPGRADTTPAFRADGVISAVLPVDQLRFTTATVTDEGGLAVDCVTGLDEAAGTFTPASPQPHPGDQKLEER